MDRLEASPPVGAPLPGRSRPRERPGPARRAPGSGGPGGEFTRIDEEDGYRITAVDRMDPFLMNVPSDSDLWMFVTSRGGLTAGRVDPDGALFPYETVDRLADGHLHTGPVTVIRVRRAGRSEVLWEPFSDGAAEDPAVERSLVKTVTGDAVTFEEIHHDLGLSFRYRWSSADALGWVRTATLENHGPEPVRIALLDGLRNVVPPGAPLALHQQSSCLVDAYKRTECDPDTRLGIFSLTARIVDRAEAAESLAAAVVWCAGLPRFDVALDRRAIEAFRCGEPVVADRLLTGQRGSYLLTGSSELAPGASERWHLVADTGRSHVDVAAIRRRISDNPDLDDEIEEELAAASAKLRRIVATADGLQRTADAASTAHHFANVLFNNLRGGVFAHGHDVSTADFRSFVAARDRRAAERGADWLAALPDELPIPELVARAADTDPDLHRLALEYLPLYFGRRHGDPSRPWNRFAIRVRDDDGSRALNYEGNWRDIFQNWEALAWSFPRFLPNLVAKFVNASTVDGFNPYRITRDGIDWEIEDPDDPWSYIGYWGDHQIVYLLKLLEALDRFSPGTLEDQLDREIFCYADVPYRIVPYRDIVADPHATIRFDDARAAEIDRRAETIGSDGRLRPGPDGSVLRVTLLEKLLVPALAKLCNLVPGGGIWMNTQRPEWNDANNALVGNGLSVVTMCYLRRYLSFLETRVDVEGDPVPVSAEVVAWLREVREHLAAHPDAPARPADRRRWLDAVGETFSRYREAVYAGGLADKTELERRDVVELCRCARECLDREIAGQRRDDGLYHSYNLLELDRDGASIHPLPAMLEGQVAALGSGAVGPDEAVRVIDALFEGPLYRPDQRSFLLYPERELPSFLEKNVVPDAGARAVPLLAALLEVGDASVLARDADGVLRFRAAFSNARDVENALDRLARDQRWTERVAADRPAVLALFEEVFRHRSFTGRSGTMYGYEGLGCVYWHMVAKLLLAVQALGFRAEREGEPAPVREALASAFDRIQVGFGFRKTAAEYGAFPTDPYSHTPRHAGAQQPGMTGQVKEEILARLGELGVRPGRGTVRFRPVLLRAAELLEESRPFRYEDPREGAAALRVPAGGLAFTFCQVPVVYERGEAAAIRVTRRDGSVVEAAGDELPPDVAWSLFDRSGEIRRIDVTIPETRLRRPAAAG